jgi:hypothetical protein
MWYGVAFRGFLPSAYLAYLKRNAMSERAQQLIAENKAKHARGEDASYLDLGNCGLTEWPDLSGMD